MSTDSFKRLPDGRFMVFSRPQDPDSQARYEQLRQASLHENAKAIGKSKSSVKVTQPAEPVTDAEELRAMREHVEWSMAMFRQEQASI